MMMVDRGNGEVERVRVDLEEGGIEGSRGF
jgi:hypothetical protein